MVITADSKPVYCVFGGSDCWTCNDLITWHQQMVAKYGKDQANTTFIDSWTNDSPVLCEQYDCRSFNSTFRTYFTQQGILPSLYSGIGVIAQPIGFVTDTTNGLASIAGSLGASAKNTANVMKYAVPVIVLIVAVGLLVYVGKQSKLI